MSRRSINILGVTGSVGQAAMDVILAQPEMFDVRLVSAHTNIDGLHATAEALNADIAVSDGIEDALIQAGRVDITLAAISGMAGLPSLMVAIAQSKAVAIANKEPLVAAGAQVLAAAAEAGCTLLPVDSEHNAVFQVFKRQGLERIILTGSGGPFRTWSKDQMAGATQDQALQHPNWSMGAKITIDSATMMNKALEVIEAAVLFDLPADQVDVMIHPQSVVHSMVEYADGSVLAQMGASDMRTPLANVLGWPDRLITPGARLDLTAMAQLDFEAPDQARFPALRLAYQALRAGQYMCVAMNAANEVAVAAFLEKTIGFLDIVACVEHVMLGAPVADFSTVKDVIAYDSARRDDAMGYIDHLAGNNKKDFA